MYKIKHVQFVVNNVRFLNGMMRDHQYHDIPLDEEEASEPSRLPHQNIRFSSWTDQECYDFTSFRKHHLLGIYDCFGLAQLATLTNGFIRNPTEHECHICSIQKKCFYS